VQIVVLDSEKTKKKMMMMNVMMMMMIKQLGERGFGNFKCLIK
jgi:hypothetical protein